MNEETMKELLFSLAWMSHSAYHSRNVREIMEKECPGCDFSQDIDKFKAIVNSESKNVILIDDLKTTIEQAVAWNLLDEVMDHSVSLHVAANQLRREIERSREGWID